mgnify:FL=1
MNVFEENQLFIPILNDARFAVELKRWCWNDLVNQFRAAVKQAVFAIQRENDLSVTIANREAVTIALWEHYQREREEEAERQYQQSTLSEPYTPRPPRSLKKEPLMSTKPPAFETKHFVNGQDTTTLSDDELIQAIKNLETEIAKLSEVKTESKKITDKISKLDEQRAAIAKLLDSRP